MANKVFHFPLVENLIILKELRIYHFIIHYDKLYIRTTFSSSANIPAVCVSIKIKINGNKIKKKRWIMEITLFEIQLFVDKNIISVTNKLVVNVETDIYNYIICKYIHNTDKMKLLRITQIIILLFFIIITYTKINDRFFF